MYLYTPKDREWLLRCGKSCRMRWINYLRPDIRKDGFTPEEDKLIISLHGIVGNRILNHDQFNPSIHFFSLIGKKILLLGICLFPDIGKRYDLDFQSPQKSGQNF
ncbi:hypothetical protein JHK82_047273 [Glycine max]|uniref:HTH myb-type domain-containing protein n=2 Tax=Glycine subgen. Soja TaxID=1462606 RepID=K7ML94_SOYBN|nr:hypothetical protein JHK86_047167 [Glycine max]KAG4932968.1 hypothetical protein JHK87_046970 [Glycine soja]KAG4943097.1 hypothetical protein JHK85_047743 [Glycine max]KAG5097419.1 hypothetical protein JHK82_047273 [Glycine max]KAG5102207.1 hypothetical protein JHK84_047176 [Glycine max]